MKSILTVIIGISLSVSASAKTSAEPAVSCSLDYSTHETDGVLISLERGTSEEVFANDSVILENNSFKAEVSLQNICAADGGPCVGYELSANISNGDIRAYTSMTLSSNPGFSRMPLQLAMGNEKAFVICDIEVKKPASKIKDLSGKLVTK